MQVNEQLYRRIFIVSLIAMAVTVVLGLGPVWLSAEATRAAQHSQHLKDEITRTLQVSESLEMQRVAITNDLRLDQSTMQDLGMVRNTAEVSYVELSDLGALGGSSLALNSSFDVNSDSVAYLASLALGEAHLLEYGEEYMPEEVSRGINFAAMARNALDTVAHLTAGEASTLLVGDVGLVGMR